MAKDVPAPREFLLVQRRCQLSLIGLPSAQTPFQHTHTGRLQLCRLPSEAPVLYALEVEEPALRRLVLVSSGSYGLGNVERAVE